MNQLSAVSLAVAFAAGFVSFASPCVLALVPGYLSFISGVPANQVEQRWKAVIRPTAAFVLEGLVDRFPYLSYGLALVLAFVGAKMLVKDFWHPPIWLSLTVIVVVLGSTIIYSWIKTRPPRVA